MSVHPDNKAFKRLSRRRAKIEAAVENLIALLDVLDEPSMDNEDSDPAEDSDPGGGDIQDEPHDEEPDKEDGRDDEPSIGWPEDFTATVGPVLQADHDPEQDDADLEDSDPGEMDFRSHSEAHPWDGLDRPWLRAARVFGMHVVGDCCVPLILSDSSVHADKEARPEVGDFVLIFFEAMESGRTVLKAWVKRLVAAIPPGMQWPHVKRPGDELVPALIVEQLNPPRQMLLDVTRVHAVFKVVNILPPAAAMAARARMRAIARH